MDPVTAALAAGASAGLTNVATQAVKDAYGRLKAVLTARFPQVEVHVQALEARPDSQAKKSSMSEELAESGAERDLELRQLAQILVEAIEREAPQAAVRAGVDLARVKAEFLNVQRVTGNVQLRDAEMTGGGINITDVGAGGGPDPKLRGAAAAAQHQPSIHVGLERVDTGGGPINISVADAQVTERFTWAIEQLGQQGGEKLAVRIGAVHALEQIAQDAVELHWLIVEVLTAYLREHARAGPDLGEPADTEKHLPADHQAIATVIGRRRSERDPAGQRLNLRATDLRGVNWYGARLEGAILIGARLEGAFLDKAHLERAILEEAHLERAQLCEAHLEAADLYEAHLEGANLADAHLERANLVRARLKGASLYGAHLEGAELYLAQGLTVEQLQWAVDPDRAELNPDLADRLAGLEGPGPIYPGAPRERPWRPSRPGDRDRRPSEESGGA